MVHTQRRAPASWWDALLKGSMCSFIITPLELNEIQIVRNVLIILLYMSNSVKTCQTRKHTDTQRWCSAHRPINPQPTLTIETSEDMTFKDLLSSLRGTLHALTHSQMLLEGLMFHKSDFLFPLQSRHNSVTCAAEADTTLCFMRGGSKN